MMLTFEDVSGASVPYIDEILFGHRSFDDGLLECGLRGWKESYGRGLPDPEATSEVLNYWMGVSVEAKRLALAHVLTFAAAWADDGYRKLVTTHKYAAALMATSLSEDQYSDIEMPGRAFLVVVPSGLLRVDGYDFDRILVDARSGHASGDVSLMVLGTGKGVPAMRIVATPEPSEAALAGALFGEMGDARLPDGAPARESPSRAMTLARRLVVGLMFSLQHTDNFRALGGRGAKTATGRDGPPNHRVAFVGREMSVDCRPAIRRYLDGSHKGAPPSVQTLVRGHYKRQVIGVTRTGRKVIWIEPYWRGPEDAPILTRPYRVGKKDEAAE